MNFILMIKMLNAEKIIEKIPAFAQALAQQHGQHEWKSMMVKTAAMMKDLAHTHLNDQDFIKIEQKVLLSRGAMDTVVTFEETDYVHHLLKNSQFKNYEDVPHPIEKVPVPLLKGECEKFFL